MKSFFENPFFLADENHVMCGDVGMYANIWGLLVIYADHGDKTGETQCG